MANNKYTYEIKVEGLNGVKTLDDLLKATSNTIGGLENRKRILEDLVKSVDRGSKEFKDFSRELNQTNLELKRFDTQIEGSVGLVRFAENATKVAGAITGAFALGTIAVDEFGGALGISKEELEKAEASFQKFLLAIQSFQALSEGFGALLNILPDIQKGITSLTGAFSNLNKVTKASIFGLGITAVALVVTYWEDISNFISGSATNLDKLTKLQTQYSLDVIKAEKALSIAKTNNLGIDKAEENLNAAKLKQLNNEILIKSELLNKAESEEEFNKASIDLANAELALENEKLRQKEAQRVETEKEAAIQKENLERQITLQNEINIITLDKALFNNEVKQNAIEESENKYLKNKLKQIELIKNNENINELKKFNLIKKLEKELIDEQNLNIQSTLNIELDNIRKKFKLEEENLLQNQNQRIQNAKSDEEREQISILNEKELSLLRQKNTKIESDLKKKADNEIKENNLKLEEDTSLQKIAAIQIESQKYISILQNATAIIASIQQGQINSLKNDISSIDSLIENNKSKIEVINSELASLEEQRNALQEDYNEALVNNNLTALQSIKDENDKITDSLKEQRKEKARLEKENLKQQDDKIKKEEQIAKKEQQIAKQNAIIALAQTATQTGLAVANIAASSAKQDATFGIATVASIAAVLGSVIAAVAQAKQLGSFAEGGFTDKNKLGSRDESGFRVAGIVHEGEYVIPKKVLDSGLFDNEINRLEAARKGSFVQGGFTSNNVTVINNNDEVISLLSVIASKDNVVKIKDINDVQNKLNSIEVSARS